MPRQRAYPLTPHRIPLVRHRARPDLVLLKRLLDLLQIREQAQVSRDLGRCRAKRRKGLENVNVDLAGVGLGCHRVSEGEIEELGYAFVKRDDLNVWISFIWGWI